jgi:hypothetical protein
MKVVTFGEIMLRLSPPGFDFEADVVQRQVRPVVLCQILYPYH